MTKFRSTLIGVAITGSLVGMIPTGGSAEPVPTSAERSACTSDAFRMCLSAIPNQTAVDCLPKVKEVAAQPDLPAAFRPDLMDARDAGRRIVPFVIPGSVEIR